MLNQCQFIGRVHSEPSSITTDKGKQVATFSLYIAHQAYDREYSELLAVVAFGKLAERVKSSINNGDLMFLQGKLQIRKYLDKVGTNRESIQIIMEKFTILDQKLEGYVENVAEIGNAR